MILGYHQFEHLLFTHCTPTLIKRKLGSMFHLDNRYSDVHELVEYYDQILNLQGLRINLFFSHGRYTVYVYLPSSLKYLMTNKDIQSFLKQYDYPDYDILSHLEKRLEMSQYPHEIGLFLGYPLADVWGFIHHKKCQCCGCWKVYEKKREKESLFKQFDCCKKEFILLYEQGYSLSQILNQADNQPFSFTLNEL